MEPQFIRAYRAEDDGEQADDGPITFIASSSSEARDKFSIAHDGWQLANFKRNNVFLWAHNYGDPPIGKVTTAIDPEAKALRATVTFDLDDPFAASIYRKYRDGFLNAVSVGFDILEIDGEKVDPMSWIFPKPGSTVTKAELLELSGVPVPADPKALAERAQRGLTADLSDLLAKLMTDEEREAQTTQSLPDSHAEVIWPGTALLMARLFLDMTDDADDDERLRRYRTLERRYRLLGKEPPEFLTRSDLCLLDDESIRGLFGSGEDALLGWTELRTAQRAGAVLSSRNKGDLEKAVALVRGVIERAQKEESEEEARAFLSQFTIDENTATDDLLARLAG